MKENVVLPPKYESWFREDFIMITVNLVVLASNDETGDTSRVCWLVVELALEKDGELM